MKNILNCFIIFGLILTSSAMFAQQKGKKTTTKTPVSKKVKTTQSTVNAMDFRSKPPVAGPAPKINIGKYESFQLENGLKVIIVENHKIPKASYQIFVDYTPFYEKDEAGMTSLSGELLGRGTHTKTKATIDAAVDMLGADINTNSNGISATSLIKYSDKLLELMSDILLNPSFPPDEFEKIKKQTLSELAQNKEDANGIASNVGQVLTYGKNHPYGEIMTETSVKLVTVEKCKDFYNTYFSPNNSYLIVVGDVVPAKEIERAKKYFGNWKRKDIPVSKLPVVSENFKTSVDFVSKSGAVQSVISLTYPVDLKPDSPDKVRAKVMNTMFGGFFRSRLNDNLREKHAYTYGVRSSLTDDKYVGRVSAGGSVRNEVTDSSLVEMIKEMNRMRTELISDDEYTSVRNVMAGDFGRSLEKPQTVAGFALNIARFGLPADYYNTYVQKLMAVSKEDIRQMAVRYLRPENMHILVVGNKDIAGKLGRFSSDGKVDYYDVYGNKLDMSAAMIPAGITAEKVMDKYFSAIGGKDKISTIKTVEAEYEAPLQGMTIKISEKKKSGGKYMQSVSVMGNTVQKQVSDGKTGMATVQGQNNKIEGDDLNDLINNADFCPQLNYASKGNNVSLIGSEKVEGKAAYQIEVSSTKGEKWSEFYDQESGLLVRELKTKGNGDETMVITTDFSDYRKVGDVLFPHKMVISGTMPFPLEAAVKSIKLNQPLDDSLFKVN